MREAEGIVEVFENVVVEKQVVKEDFSHYTVNKKEKKIDVVVEKMAEDNSVVNTEYYQFGEKNYLDSPNESYLWSLVDEARAGV